MNDASVFSRIKLTEKAPQSKKQKQTSRQPSLFDFNIFASNLPGVCERNTDFDDFISACVVFVEILKKEQLEKLLVVLKPFALLKRLFICSNNVTAASLVTLKKKYIVEVFSPTLCLLRPEKHIGQPRMRLAARSEVDALIGEKEESSLELCKISLQDPTVKFNGWTVNNIVHIKRPSQDGIHVEFRIVSSDGG